jgi:predicted small metal-binding protein
MKSMTCSQLGGACDAVFSGASFDELAAQSQQHGKDMFAANDSAHIDGTYEIWPNGNMDG